MAEQTRYFTIAILLTVLDTAVAWRCGTVIWTAWSRIIWARELMLLLTAVWVTSLADVWPHAVYGLDRSPNRQLKELVPQKATVPAESQGDGDV